MRKISFYGGGYFVNESGEVFNRHGKKMTSGRWGSTGYLKVTLCCNGVAKNFGVHRVVALTFIPNPDGKPEVNHKDGNKHNNHISNLEWATVSENRSHSYHVLGNTAGTVPMKGKFGKDHNKSKEITIMTPDEDVMTFGSVSEMTRETGYTQTAITQAARNNSLPYTFKRGKNKGMTILKYNYQLKRK